MEKKERKQKNKEKGNGEGTIYKSSKTGLYVGQYVTNGKRHSVYQKKNEKIGDFKKRFNDILSSINTGTYIEKSNETFISILEKHIEQKHDDGITSDSGYLRDLYSINLIKNTCDNFIYKPIQKIDADDIESSKKRIREYSQTSIDKAWRLLNKTFKLAISRRKVMFNPFDDETLTKPISIKETKKVEALTIKEEKKLRKILNTKELEHKYRNIVLLQLDTGMRIGEVLARSKNDIDLNNNTLYIHNTLTKDTQGKLILGKHTKTYNKKTGIDSGERTIKMNSEIKQIIAQQLSSKIVNVYQLLFWDYENNTFVSYSEINSWLKRLNAKYKITKLDLSTHNLRHTYITRLREAGVDMKIIQYIVGHVEGSSITNDIYTSLSEEFIDKELKKVK